MTTASRKNLANQSIDQTLFLTRVFDAPRDLVFKSWTQPQRMKQWCGPKGFTCPVCKINVHTGGGYLNCMRSPEGKDYWSKGVYKEIEVPQRLVCTDSFADEHGNIVSPQEYGMSTQWPREALITVIFTEHAGKTRIMLQHSPINPGQERDMCQQGWSESLDKLALYLKRAGKQMK
jgi:uncharacterized protein YndB with AHSA1/START domain